MAMNYSERELQRLGDNDLAKMIHTVKDIFQQRHPGINDIPLPVQAKSSNESETPQIEVVDNYEASFSNEQREALLNDGAVLYLPTGQTIYSQKRAGRKLWSVVNRKLRNERVVAFPSRKIEVAIYPDPERFFIPGSFNKTTDQMDYLIAKDAENLRKRLGIEGITMWRPEASEVTEVVFRHFDETNIRLLGKDYKEQAGGYYPYIRTSTPINESGLAMVGGFYANRGPEVKDWDRNESLFRLGAARWVVPQRTR